MASEQENRIVAEVMDNMKMAETEESSARRYVRRAVDKILIYCCREDLPERLEGTAAQIAEDMLWQICWSPQEKKHHPSPVETQRFLTAIQALPGAPRWTS